MNRVWIYQADRILSNDMVVAINEELEDFTKGWTAHGSSLASTAQVEHNLFIVIQVDESVAGVTGCSIDKSVHFIKALGEKFNIDFFDRMRVAYLDNDIVVVASKSEFEQLIKSGKVNMETIVFNNLLQNSDELHSQWKLPFKDSWHARVF